MPKMKTHSGAGKRFRLTGTGKVMRRRANRNHLLEHKSSRRTRRLASEIDAGPRGCQEDQEAAGEVAKTASRSHDDGTREAGCKRPQEAQGGS